MSPTVLVINSGSSSLKYEVVDPATGRSPAQGIVERIGGPGSTIRHTVGDREHTGEVDGTDHVAAFGAMIDAFTDHGPDLAAVELAAVGHRVVHGGDRFHGPVIIDEAVITAIDELAELAPLHNPANLDGLHAARERFGELPHVAVFDTAFHQRMPAAAYTYAIDAELADRHAVRRYGFHGTSYAHVSRAAADLLGRDPAELSMIVLHLGNGASAAAIRGGVSIDTSMGLTPLEGLVMGTRSGDLDPAVLFHLARTAGLDLDGLDDLLNRRSGLLGLCGRSDMRDVVAAADGGDEAARLALAVYTHRARQYLGAYTAVLGRLDAVVFTAGVGENAAAVRELITADLTVLGIDLDPAANAAAGSHPRDVATADSAVRVLVIPTDEEGEIARQTIQLVGDQGQAGPAA